MAGFFPLKMKRKELEEVNDDFSDFSLSSPARKIRRLDAELPPIIEEEPEDPVTSMMMAEEYVPSGLEQVRGSGPVIEELPENEERAIVLYNSANTPLLQSPSNHFSVDPKILSGLKNKLIWSSQSNVLRSAEDEAARHDSDATTTNGCLAVVPWVPSLLSSAAPEPESPQAEVLDLMDAEDMEATTMDIEEDTVNIPAGQGFGYNGGIRGNEGLQQQQQQHCMVPELPQSTSTPVVWFQ